MPLVGECCVNLSGRNVTVTDGKNHAIGELMNREFFTVVGAEGSLVAIYFLGPSGQPLRGYLNNAPASSKTPIHTRPYGTVSLNGQNYIAFMMRQTMNLYNFNGQVVGSVAAGKRVLCKSSMASIDSPFLKAINFAEKRTGGWDSMADSTGAYGYVDTGLRTSSSASGIALYGNW